MASYILAHASIRTAATHRRPSWPRGSCRRPPGGALPGTRIISRTVAYAIVTGLLVGVYAGLVLLTTQVFRVHTPVAVAASTLAAAALFNPVRRRVQQMVDRRFNRARYDADQTIAAFAARLKDAVDLDSALGAARCGRGLRSYGRRRLQRPRGWRPGQRGRRRAGTAAGLSRRGGTIAAGNRSASGEGTREC